MEAAANSTEVQMLGWSTVLLLVHILVQTLFYVKDVGLAYALSNREEGREAGAVASRLLRGVKNFVETYGIFVALVLGLALTGRTGGLAATGALIWFWARVVYVPVFALGVPALRTGVWTVSVIGLVLMMIRLLGA